MHAVPFQFCRRAARPLLSGRSCADRGNARLGRSAEKRDGGTFVHRYGLPKGITVAEFLIGAFQERVSQAEWNDFLASQPWFEAHYLDRIVPLMEANGVIVATYAFTLNPFDKGNHPGQRVTAKTAPWFLNDLFVPTLVVAPVRDLPR